MAEAEPLAGASALVAKVTDIEVTDNIIIEFVPFFSIFSGCFSDEGIVMS